MTTIGIIGGKGRIGHAVAALLREQGHDVLIADRRTKLTIKEVAKKAEVVIVAVPIDQTERVIREVAPVVRPSALFMDVTSIKEAPVKAMLESRAAVIGTHPMCSETTFGPGQTLLYCPARPGKWGKWFRDTFGSRGGFNLVKIAPRCHDERMAVVLALIHFTEFALGETLRTLEVKVEDLMKFVSPASELRLKLAARHLAQDSNLYGNIQIKNPRTPAVLRAYVEAVGELWKIIETSDLKAFERYFNRGARYFGKFGMRAFLETDRILGRMTRPPLKQPVPFPPGSVATLGPDLTHSALAAKQWGRGKPCVFLPTIEDIFDAVSSGKAAYGVVPMENRLHGTVRETLDALFSHELKIIAELKRPIHHVLAIPKGSRRTDITTVMSHAQALHQCSKIVKTHFPDAVLQIVDSTATAFKQADLNTAVLGTEEAARAHGFRILKKNAENDVLNTTTFVVVAKRALETRSRDRLKTSIVFYFAANKPGSLFSVFKIFADLGINLSRIESRPTGKKLGEYLFYLDFDADAIKGNGKKAMEQLKKIASKVQWLGTYPAHPLLTFLGGKN